MNSQNGLQRFKSFIFNQYVEFAAAVRFLSLLPVPGSVRLFNKDERVPHIVVGCEYFPVVGMLLAFCSGYLRSYLLSLFHIWF